MYLFGNKVRKTCNSCRHYREFREYLDLELTECQKHGHRVRPDDLSCDNYYKGARTMKDTLLWLLSLIVVGGVLVLVVAVAEHREKPREVEVWDPVAQAQANALRCQVQLELCADRFAKAKDDGERFMALYWCEDVEYRCTEVCPRELEREILLRAAIEKWM